MKAITFGGYRTAVHETVPDPEIETPGDVIVKVDIAGLCGSDLHPYNEREEGLDLGAVMGHEFVGEIVETGAEVGALAVGDRVFSPFTTNCGNCSYCRAGLTSRCPQGQLFGWVGMGEGLQGCQAQLVRVPLAESTLLRIPQGITDEQALLLGDIFSTAYFCAEMAGAGPGGVHAVVGCGPVGILTIIAARDLGAEMIYAIDSVPERLELAHQVGAVPIDFQAENPVMAIRDSADAPGADTVMEAAGTYDAARMAIELVRPGGTISVVSVHTDDTFPFSPVEAYDKNLTYRVGRCPARAYMERLAPIVRDRELDITRVISHRLPLRMVPTRIEASTSVVTVTPKSCCGRDVPG